MGELPTTRPTHDLEWATTGDKTEPSAGAKASGFTVGTTIAHDQINWRFNAVFDWVEWLKATTIRIFSTLYDAAASDMAVGEICRIPQTTFWLQDGREITPKTATTILSGTVDGGYAYLVMSDGTITKHNAISNSAYDPIWEYAGAITSVRHVMTDGYYLAVSGGASGGFALYVINCSTGALFLSRTFTQMGEVACIHTHLHTDSAGVVTIRAIADGGGYQRYEAGWTTQTGAYTSFVRLLDGTWAGGFNATTPNWLTKSVIASATTILTYSASGSGGSPDSLLVYDGEAVFALFGHLNSTSTSVIITALNTSLSFAGSYTLWTKTITSAEGANLSYCKMAVDNRYLYVLINDYLVIFDKRSGLVAYKLAVTTADALGTSIHADEHQVWLADGTGFYEVQVARQTGLYLKTDITNAYRPRKRGFIRLTQ